MQQKVTKGMDDFIPQSGRHGKHAAVHHGSGGSRHNGLDMANTTTDMREKSLAPHGGGGRGELRVPGWNHRAAYELGKVVDVGQAKLIRLIVDALGTQKNVGDLVGAQPIG